MKLNVISIVMVVILSVMLVSTSGNVLAADGQNGSGCSVATLNGSYGFYRTGTSTDGPLAAVGIAFYDGKGNFNVRQRVSRNGALSKGKVSGQYTVAGDCTTKGFFSGSENFFGVVVDNGNSFYFLSESGSSTVYGVATKIHQP